MSIIKTNKVPRIWILGPPGSGKSTQAEILSENFGYTTINIRTIYSEEARKETDRGRLLKETLDTENQDVPDVSGKTKILCDSLFSIF